MNTSRRTLISGLGVTVAGLSTQAFAQANKNPAAPAQKKAVVDTATNLQSPIPNKEIKILSLDRLEQDAKKVLSPSSYAFISNGAGGEWTLKQNRTAFDKYQILTKRLTGVGAEEITTSVSMLGTSMSSPIMVAPMGAHLFAHHHAEIATAAGVGAAKILYQSSGASTRTMEDIARAHQGPRWFQLYMNNDEAVTRNLLERAKAAGYTAIILTVDAMGPGMSEEYLSLGPVFPPNFTFANNDPKLGGMGDFGNQKQKLTPADIQFIKSVTGLPVIVKGLMRAEDAEAAIQAGADAIQVSNHGGRQLDGVPAAIDVLAPIAQRVQNRVPIIFDSGIRRGIDIFKALALGANAVAVGRPILYGLALGGSLGVKSVLDHLSGELRQTMLLAGSKDIKDINSTYIFKDQSNN